MYCVYTFSHVCKNSYVLNTSSWQDINEPKQFRWKPPSIGTKQEWHDRLRNIGRSRKGSEDTENIESVKMPFPMYDSHLYLQHERYVAEAKASYYLIYVKYCWP